MKIALSILFFINFITAFCQKPLKRNSLSVFYSPQISKTNFDRSIRDGTISGPDYYQTAQPNKPVIGYNLGLTIQRILMNKGEVIFQYRHNLNGQSSRFTYNYKGIIPSDTVRGYGGMKYKLLMWTNTFSLGYSHHIYGKDNLSIYCGINTGINIYSRAILQNYILLEDEGIVIKGCCTDYFTFASTYRQLNGFFYPIQKGFFRIESNFYAGAKYMISNRIFFTIKPEFIYLSKLLSTAPEVGTTVPQGTAFSFGISFGTGLNF